MRRQLAVFAPPDRASEAEAVDQPIFRVGRRDSNGHHVHRLQAVFQGVKLAPPSRETYTPAWWPRRASGPWRSPVRPLPRRCPPDSRRCPSRPAAAFLDLPGVRAWPENLISVCQHDAITHRLAGSATTIVIVRRLASGLCTRDSSVGRRRWSTRRSGHQSCWRASPRTVHRLAPYLGIARSRTDASWFGVASLSRSARRPAIRASSPGVARA